MLELVASEALLSTEAAVFFISSTTEGTGAFDNGGAGMRLTVPALKSLASWDLLGSSSAGSTSLSGTGGLLDASPSPSWSRAVSGRRPDVFGTGGGVDGAETFVDRAGSFVDGMEGVVDSAEGVVDGSEGVVDDAEDVVEGAVGVVEGAEAVVAGDVGAVVGMEGVADTTDGVADDFGVRTFGASTLGGGGATTSLATSGLDSVLGTGASVVGDIGAGDEGATGRSDGGVTGVDGGVPSKFPEGPVCRTLAFVVFNWFCLARRSCKTNSAPSPESTTTNCEDKAKQSLLVTWVMSWGDVQFAAPLRRVR